MCHQIFGEEEFLNLVIAAAVDIADAEHHAVLAETVLVDTGVAFADHMEVFMIVPRMQRLEDARIGVEGDLAFAIVYFDQRVPDLGKREQDFAFFKCHDRICRFYSCYINILTFSISYV